MKLVLPDMTYKDRAIEYINEFYTYGSQINGSGSLDRFLRESTYEQWLAKLRSDMDIANLPPSKVPALTYFFVREEDGKIIGMVNIRLALNGFLRSWGGHIGYSVRPTERRRGYGTELLRQALQVCGRVCIGRVLVTCDKSNPASAGVIKNCGGALEDEIPQPDGEILQRYWIEL
ncbi:MAG: GNAT family N-acetyltransferase [Oscillospiraceae bacterium]|nr:GNAT family N-acetyltransferase [Oscillospiraceae bacterium]